MVEQPENLVLELLRGLRAEMGGIKAEMTAMREEMVTKGELKSEINSLRADVASDFLTVNKDIAELRKETREQITGVRRALIEYHSTVVGHGMLISDLDERVRRLERRLDAPAVDAH